MSDKFFNFHTKLNLNELFSAYLTPHIEKLNRSCPSLPDEDFINAGIRRIVSECKTGRDFLQKSDEIFDIHIAKSTFSDAMSSARRLDFVSEVSSANYKSLEQELSNDRVDYLSEFKDFEGYDVFSVDGHYIAHSSHTQRDSKGKLYAAGNLYALNIRNGLMRQFACVSDGSDKNHEMPIFREMLEIENSIYKVKNKTIWINDRAYIDHRWWMKQKRNGNHIISRSKSNSAMVCCGELSFDTTDPVNTGVVSDKLCGISNGVAGIRVIEYVEPETGEEMTFYTTLGKEIMPGAICWLYFLRWRIEKVFDCFKNALWQTKAWANGKIAMQIQGHFICIFYNYMQFLLEKTKKHESCEDKKSEKKYKENLELREKKAKQIGRYIHPLIYTYRKISRMSCQFIRSVKNYFFSEKPLSIVLPIFAERLKRYL